VILHYTDGAGFDVPPDQVIDPVAGTVTVTTDTFSPFLVVDRGVFETIWEAELLTPDVPDPPVDPDADPVSEPAPKLVDVTLLVEDSTSAFAGDPDGLRRTAALGVIDSLATYDRLSFTLATPQRIGSVVDFPHAEIRHLIQFPGISFNLFGVTNTTEEINLPLAFQVALNNQDVIHNPHRPQVIVLFTRAVNANLTAMTERAVASNTVVFTVGLGAGTNEAALQAVSKATGGRYFSLEDTAGLAAAIRDVATGKITTPQPDPQPPLPPPPPVADTDGDGLADLAETSGWRTNAGVVYVTDPSDADTDGDGLTDGDEAGDLLRQGVFGVGSAYRGISNPLVADSDEDGLDDLHEVANLLNPRSADGDRDSLSDDVETQVYGTEVVLDDTDIDGFRDDWEVAHEADGYDPLVFDYQMGVAEYVGDFARGALCGDIVGGPFGACQPVSMAYIIGTLVLGLIAVGDVRDLLANTFQGDVINAGISAIGVAPILGDGVRVVRTFTKAADRLADAASGVVKLIGDARAEGLATYSLRAAMRNPNVSLADKIKSLDDAWSTAYPEAMTKLRKGDLTDEDIIKLASGARGANHLGRMITGAKAVLKSPPVALEKAAEEELWKTVLKVKEVTKDQMQQFKTSLPSLTGGKPITRFFDVRDPDGFVGFEVKHGTTRWSGHAQGQPENDREILRRGQSGIESIEWHFFTSARGRLGPDPALLENLEKAIAEKLQLTYYLYVG
jgi:hypothetical protein